MAAFWAPQLLYKPGSRRGKKSIFLSSCKRLPKTETQTERQVLGEVTGPGLAARTLRSQNPQVQVPLQVQELNPSQNLKFRSHCRSRNWIHPCQEILAEWTWALDVEVSLGRVPEAGDLQRPCGDCRIQALIQGLVFQWTPKRKKKNKSRRLKWFFMHFSIIAIFSARFLQHEENAKH